MASVGNGENDTVAACWREITEMAQSVSEMKAAAARMRAFLKNKLNLNISHSHALELAAIYENHPNWDTACAVVPKQSGLCRHDKAAARYEHRRHYGRVLFWLTYLLLKLQGQALTKAKVVAMLSGMAEGADRAICVEAVDSFVRQGRILLVTESAKHLTSLGFENEIMLSFPEDPQANMDSARDV